jgi:DNA-binding CsgD family transcriptional regulator
MIVSFDYVLQIIAISTSLGALIVLFYLYFLLRQRKILFFLLMVLANTLNYFSGIIAYTIPISNSNTIAFELFSIFQILTAILIIEFTRMAIESLGKPQLLWIKGLTRLLYLIPLILFITFRFSSRPLISLMSNLSILFLGVLLWIHLWKVQTDGKLLPAVRRTALIAYAFLIPGYMFQSIFSEQFSVRFMEPLSFIFLTFSTLIFSVYFLTQRRDRPNHINSDLNLQQQYGLTDRELEVLNLLIKSSSYKEIASSLGISMATVKTHVSRVYKKTETKGRSELKFRFSE